jgi:hypothetical protein
MAEVLSGNVGAFSSVAVGSVLIHPALQSASVR